MGFWSGIWKAIAELLGREPSGPRPLTSGKAVFRISGIERVPFGNGPGELDNWIVLTALWADGLAEGPALELALRGVEDEVAERRPVGGKVGLVARWSPNLQIDNRLYHENKLRPESDYLGEGVGYAARLPLGPALGAERPGTYYITVTWGAHGVMVSTPAASVLLEGKHPEAAAFGFWHPGALNLGWGSASQDGTRKGLVVQLQSWTAVGPQPERIEVT